MRILYIVPFVPWPLRVRSSNLIPRLARRHVIDLLCLAGSEKDVSKLNGVGEACASVRYTTHSRMRALLQAAAALPTSCPARMAYASSGAMKAAVEETIAAKRPDVIYVERWRALQYVPRNCGIPVVCDPTDSMILYNRRLVSNGSWWEKIVGAEEYVKFRRYEPLLARRSDVTVFCSTHDRDCLLQQDATLNCEIIPNGVDCDHFFQKNADEVEESSIVLTGNFGYHPNFHAAVYFIREILPLVRSVRPEVRLLAVGHDAARALSAYRMPGIELVDFVPDLRPYIARATVAVAPLTVGTGVSNKVLEAFAVGTPVVATSLACGDLPVRNGEHLFLANDTKLFASRVLELLNDASLRVRLAENARKLVDAKYNWEIVSQDLENLMLRLVDANVPFSPVSSASRLVRTSN
jgi:polysaccharide biosynthesis protein PslH